GLYDVRRVIPPAVGDGGRHIGHLKWCHSKFTLTDGKRNNRVRFPAVLAVIFVVIRSWRYKTVYFAGDVDAEFAAQAKPRHVIPPFLITGFGVGIFVDNTFKN